MEETVAFIRKYQARLNPQYGSKKILRALQKLNDIEMTADLLKATGVREDVRKLRKDAEFANLSCEIAAKWKKLASSDTRHAIKMSHPAKKRKSAEYLQGCEPAKKKSRVEIGRRQIREAKLPLASYIVTNREKMEGESRPVNLPEPSAKPRLILRLRQIQTSSRPQPVPEQCSDIPKTTGLTDSQAAELHAKRQTKKLRVYSGDRGAVLPTMTSLFDQCMMTLKNNIDAIDSLGGIPFDILQPVLKKCSPEQLYRLEDSNQYLLKDTDVLWKTHCANKFPKSRPAEMESYREMYFRLIDERERKLASLSQTIKMKEAKKKCLENKIKLVYVGANAKPQRSAGLVQEKIGVAGRSRLSSSVTSQSSSSVPRRDLVDSRTAIASTAPAATKGRMQQVHQGKKPRVAPLMSKTLQSIKRMKLRR